MPIEGISKIYAPRQNKMTQDSGSVAVPQKEPIPECPRCHARDATLRVEDGEYQILCENCGCTTHWQRTEEAARWVWKDPRNRHRIQFS